MPALYPMMVAPEDFKPGDTVRKFINDQCVTPFCGVVTHIVPATCKVWVQWPIEHSQESPETLIKVNPFVFGLPSVTKDKGYDSYEKSLSERLYGMIPKGASEQDKMALRIAHTFATDVVGKLVDDIVDQRKNGLSDVQTYYRIFPKYSSICSDYIIQSSIKRVFADSKSLKKEMIDFLKNEFKGLEEVDSDDFKFDMEAAIYWYASQHHGGQDTDLYSILSTSKFKPSPLHKSIKDEGETAKMCYDALKKKYRGK